MTEKRFKVIETITHDDKRVYELTKNDIGYYNFKGEKLLAHMICNELNKLLEENEKLKSDNKSYVKRYGELFDEYTKLEEENKELKYKYDEQSNEKMGLEEDIDRLLKKNKELKYHLNRTEKELKEYKDFMSLG